MRGGYSRFREARTLKRALYVRSLLSRIAGLGDTDRLERASHWRRFESGLRHELPQQQTSIRMADRRLHADADEAVGVIHRLPGVHRELAAAVVGVAVVPDIDAPT